jgi:hypothetical protein
MPKRFPIYETCLKLYPKCYREEYADQMVQTLADMLDDQPDKRRQLVVWLRASSELPVAIAQQNVTSIGEKAMNKLATTSNKRLAIIAGIVVAVTLVMSIHNWINHTVIPNTTGVFYRHGIATMLADQNRKLTNPMLQLYGSLSPSRFDCDGQALRGIPMTVNCTSTLQAYSKLPQDDAGKQRILKNVASIEAALTAQGYHGGGNGVTLGSLVGGTYEGRDYSADAYYEKVFGHYDCIFDTMIAYGNPQPAAIRTQFWCTRTINLLGIPHNNLYQSGKGTPAY